MPPGQLPTGFNTLNSILGSWGPMLGLPRIQFGVAQPQQRAAPVDWTLGGGAAGRALPTPQETGAALYAQRNAQLQQDIFSVFPNAQMGSGVRSRERQAELVRQMPGVASSTSRHPIGDAQDFQIPGLGARDLPQVRTALAQAGVEFEDVLYHNNHFHIERPPRRSGGDPWTAPRLQTLDPQALAGLIPMPNAANYAPIDLPDAPQRGAAPPRPQMEQIDVNALTQQFAQYAPKPFDEGRARALGFQDLMAGIAAGAASVDPATQGTAALIAAIGAGAAGARARNTRMTNEERAAAEEMARQFGLDLTRVRVGAEDANRQTRNANANLTWQDTYDELERQFNNQSAAWDAAIKEMMTNVGRQDAFTAATEAAQTRRAQVAIGATEANVNTANRTAETQADLNLKKLMFDTEQQNQVGQDVENRARGLLTGVGILDPRGDPLAENAARAAGYIASGNREGAVSALGNELAATGGVQRLADAARNAGDRDGAKELEEIAALPPDQQGAAMSAWLNTNSTLVPQVAQAMAQFGGPTAAMLARSIKPGGQ